MDERSLTSVTNTMSSLDHFGYVHTLVRTVSGVLKDAVHIQVFLCKGIDCLLAGSDYKIFRSVMIVAVSKNS